MDLTIGSCRFNLSGSTLVCRIRREIAERGWMLILLGSVNGYAIKRPTETFMVLLFMGLLGFSRGSGYRLKASSAKGDVSSR
jgi:hypothetical protein